MFNTILLDPQNGNDVNNNRRVWILKWWVGNKPF